MNEKPPSESQRRIIWFALTALALAVLVAVIVAFVWGIGELLGLLSPVLWPLAIAAVLSYLLDPAVNWLEHHRVSRAWGIVIVFVAGLLIFGGILASVIPQLVQETNALVSKIPRYTATAQQRFEHWANTGPEGGVSAPTNQASKASNPKSPPPKTAPQTALATNAPPSGVGNARIHQQLVSSAKSWLGKAMPRLGQWLLGLLSKASSLVDVAIAIILIPI
ncbi:MAG: AI-2E family transporter, partial [Verrucomicrobia bacterium]|nr:AI-2E family transporter [Verrucomicrobiota bacterium]